MDKRELAKLLSRLTSLKTNLPSSISTDEKYVNEFHSVLGGLEKIVGEQLKEFYMPNSEMKSYQNETYCDREFLLMKIDGVLGYFTLSLQPEEIKDELGFKVEEK